ncbi:MAG: FAD-binding oxidoreductase [Planctomycetes bacterium]|nr:FAD-binding oxidoreductase [Planctomycetota bacterium]
MRVQPRIFWHEQAPQESPPMPLAQDARTEVVVVGGGVAGLSCAQALGKQGRKVVLLEKDRCGSGASGKSSGFVTPDSEMELCDLIRNLGPGVAKRLWEFALGGVEAILANIRRFGIDCDLQVQDSLFLAASKKGAAVVQAEHAARQAFGYGSTLHDRESLTSLLGSNGSHGGLRYSRTFGINAHRYCRAMRDVLLQSGVVIHEQTRVTAAGKGQVTANGHTVRADAVVLCLDRFLPEVDVIPRQVYHVQTFLAVSAPLRDAQVAAIFPEARLMVWDTDLIYQYFRVIGGNRLLIGAASLLYTYGKERAVAPRILRKMRSWLGQRFPHVPVEIEYFWPGLIGVSKDFLPLAARDTADPTLSFMAGATGLAWADALGRYVAEMIQSNRRDFEAEFDPGRRFPIGNFVQGLIGKPNAFALSHGIEKYFR